jgi:hypothetical protein
MPITPLGDVPICLLDRLQAERSKRNVISDYTVPRLNVGVKVHALFVGPMAENRIIKPFYA